MPNPYYQAPSSNIPLTTVRSANENADRIAVEAAFDRIPDVETLQRSLFGIDVSTTGTLYEIEVPFIEGSYIDGQEITFSAALSNTGTANVRLNTGNIVPLVTSNGSALTAGTINAGGIVKIIYSGTRFYILNVANVGAAAVDSTDNYAWTGTQDFTAATVVGLPVENTENEWTNNNNFTQIPTYNDDPLFSQANIWQARIPVFTNTTNLSIGPAAVGSLFLMNSPTPVTFTLNTSLLSTVEVGASVSLCQTGAGQVTITPEGGTVISSETGLVTNAQYAFATLIYTGANNWIASGSLTT